MDFLKKHYEKVLLGVVLLGLAVAVAFLPFKIASEKQNLEEMRSTLLHPKVDALTNLDLAGADLALKRVAASAVVDFGTPHKLFNPMPWQKAADGQLIKKSDSNIGPNAVTIAKMTPLYLKLTLNEVSLMDGTVRCKIGVENEAALTSKDRKKEKYCKLGDKNETFLLREIKPLPTGTNVVLELNDTSQRVELGTNQPFRRIEGHMVDLKYAPENKVWTSRRVGAALNFNGEDYNIVAITENEVVLSAKSNQKKWTIKYSASASP